MVRQHRRQENGVGDVQDCSCTGKVKGFRPGGEARLRVERPLMALNTESPELLS
jgi:hypothetical protein